MFLTTAFLAAFASVTMAAPAADLDAKFLIERKGKVIGFHEVDVSETGNGQRVDTRIKMRVGLGPVTLFRYEHKAAEVWRDGVLISLVSRTNRNGKKTYVDAKLIGENLIIDGSARQGPAPHGALPSSYWDRDLVNADHMINTQTGEIMNIKVTPVGKSPAPGGRVAEQFRLVEENTLNLWYDGARWVGSNFTIDGETLDYVLVDTPRELTLLEKLRD